VRLGDHPALSLVLSTEIGTDGPGVGNLLQNTAKFTGPVAARAYPCPRHRHEARGCSGCRHRRRHGAGDAGAPIPAIRAG